MTCLLKDADGNYRFFDAIAYLDANPDVAADLERGKYISAEEQFLKTGQYQGASGIPLLDEVFDEEEYLSENPDVAEAIRLGAFPSGRVHFIEYGHNECRSGAPDPKNPVSLQFPGPLPPSGLRKRVHGVVQVSSFERVGKAVSGNILEAIRPHFATFDGKLNVLDFGCGCGRVLAFMKIAREMEIVGNDIDEEAIDWCRGAFPDVQFIASKPMPPVDLPSNKFDLVYSVSVMTHLPEEMQTAWLGELSRVTKHGGILVLTTRGIHQVDLSRWQRLVFRYKGFLHCGGRLTAGLPEFYRSAFHSESYVRKHWSKFFEILDFIPRGINGDQDMVICRKRF